MLAPTAAVQQLEARLANEVAEGALLSEIESTLARLRRAYREDKSAFEPALIDRLKRLATVAAGLRLFTELLDRHADMGDPLEYQCAMGDFATLLVLFEGLPVRVRIEREWEALQALYGAVPAPPLVSAALPTPVLAPTMAAPDLFRL